MSKFFSYDSLVWRFMGRIADSFILTLLFILTSLPIFTIGTSFTTVYYITLKMADNTEGHIILMYFKFFKKIFAESTKYSLLMILIGAFLAGDILICLHFKNASTTFFMASFFFIGIVYLMLMTYFFPVMARMDGTLIDYMKISFFMSIKYFSWTILLLVIPLCIIVVGLFIFWPLLFFSIGMIAYLQSLIFHQIFKKQGLCKE